MNLELFIELQKNFLSEINIFIQKQQYIIFELKNGYNSKNLK